MQRPIDSSLLLLLSGNRNVLHFLVLILALATAAASGQESVLTLAMLRYDQPVARTPIVAGHDSAASSFSHVSVPRLQYQVADLKRDYPSITGFPFETPIKGRKGFYQRDWLQLVPKKSGGDGRTDFWGHIEAGYGQFCQLEFAFGKSTMELEQPSCAYLKARFSF